VSILDELTEEEERRLRGAWMARLMFGWMLPADLAYVETRTYEEYLAAAAPLKETEQ
jgi:hypothetical protein